MASKTKVFVFLCQFNPVFSLSYGHKSDYDGESNGHADRRRRQADSDDEYESVERNEQRSRKGRGGRSWQGKSDYDGEHEGRHINRRRLKSDSDDEYDSKEHSEPNDRFNSQHQSYNQVNQHEGGRYGKGKSGSKLSWHNDGHQQVFRRDREIDETEDIPERGDKRVRQRSGHEVRSNQADREINERERGGYGVRRRQGGITVSNSGNITVTPTHSRKRAEEDTKEEVWVASQNEMKNKSLLPPPSDVLRQIAPNLTFNGPRSAREEQTQVPRPSKSRGRGTAFGRDLPKVDSVTPVAAVPHESGPKRYSIQRGQRSVPGQPSPPGQPSTTGQLSTAGQPSTPGQPSALRQQPVHKQQSVAGTETVPGQQTIPGQSVKENSLMSVVKDNTLMSTVTDPQQQKDLLNLASGPQPQPPSSLPQQILSGAPASSIPTAIIPPYTFFEALTPAEQLVIQEFRHQIQMQQEQRRSGHDGSNIEDDTPTPLPFSGPSLYSMYPPSQQLPVLPPSMLEGGLLSGHYVGGVFYPMQQTELRLSAARSTRPSTAVPIVNPKDQEK
jgi:hypothetical protein